MRAQQHIDQHTEQGHLGRRLNRTIGAIAIAAGLTVTGMSATTHADEVATTTLTLHNTTTNSNYASGSPECGPSNLDSTKSYFHFIVSTNDYSFVSITLHLSPPDKTISYTNGTDGAIINGKQAFIPVPTGYSLTSLQGDSTATITPAVADGEALPLFNLSHTCTAVATEETTPATQATTPATQATTPATQATTPATQATTPATQATTPATQATTPATQATTPATQAATPAPVAPTEPSTPANGQVASEAPVFVPATAVASQAMSAPNDVSLPVTGSNTASGIAIGVAMVGAGLVLSTLGRRRTARNGV